MNSIVGSYRWRIVALLFFATTINYIDRNVLSFTMIDEGFRRQMLGISGNEPLSKVDIDHFKELMGFVDASFKIAYAIGFILVGWFIDKIGTKKGFAYAITVWSIAGISHAFVNTFGGLSITRAFLGIGEAGNFPSAVKSVSEWFPKKERSFATGVFNAGANVGIIATAFSVPYIIAQYGWRWSFIITGSLGLILIILWIIIYKRPEDHINISKEELQYISSDTDEQINKNEKLSWAKLLTHKQTWAIVIGKFMADPVWYFYLTWLPDFFNSNEALDQKLELKNISWPFLFIYIISDIGSVFFGWLSSKFIKIGWSVNRARKTTMFLCALCVIPIIFAANTSSIYLAVGLLALATAAHQGWSANVYTMSSDLFPKNNIGSVMGIGGMFGAIGGILIATFAGIIRVKYGYLPLFVFAGSTYLVALGIIHILTPNWKKINFISE